MLVSNAKSAAMQLGLHRPENIQDFSRSKRRLVTTELEEAARIWSACYIAAQRSVAYFSYVSFTT